MNSKPRPKRRRRVSAYRPNRRHTSPQSDAHRNPRRHQSEDRAPASAEQPARPKKPTGRPRGAFGTLIPELQRAISSEGYTNPTQIQAECIPPVLDGCDVIGSAQTGTGKTAAFALPLLQQLSFESRRPRSRAPRALILAPPANSPRRSAIVWRRTAVSYNSPTPSSLAV